MAASPPADVILLVFNHLSTLELFHAAAVSRTWQSLVRKSLKSRIINRLELTECYKGDPDRSQTFTEQSSLIIEDSLGHQITLANKPQNRTKCLFLSLALKILKACRKAKHLSLLGHYPQHYYDNYGWIKRIERKIFGKNMTKFMEMRKMKIAQLTSKITQWSKAPDVDTFVLTPDLVPLLKWITPANIDLEGQSFLRIDEKLEPYVIDMLVNCKSVSMRYNVGDMLTRDLFLSLTAQKVLCFVTFEQIPFVHYFSIIMDWYESKRSLVNWTFMMCNRANIRNPLSSVGRIKAVQKKFSDSRLIDDPTYMKIDCAHSRCATKHWVLEIPRKDGKFLYFRIIHANFEQSYMETQRICWAQYEIATELQKFDARKC